MTLFFVCRREDDLKLHNLSAYDVIIDKIKIVV